MPNASVAPTGAEKTALKIIASKADASRTRPDDCRTNNDEDCLDVSMSYSFWITVKTSNLVHAARRKQEYAYRAITAGAAHPCNVSATARVALPWPCLYPHNRKRTRPPPATLQPPIPP